MDCSLKPPDRSGLFMGRGIKRKRGVDENGGPLSEPEEGPPATYTNSWEQHRKIKSKLKRKGDAKVSGNHMETGYIVSCFFSSEFCFSLQSKNMTLKFVQIFKAYVFRSHIVIIL